LLKNEYQFIVDKYPDAVPAIKLLFTVLLELKDLASFTPTPVGQSEEWAAIISFTEETRENYCKSLRRKTLFSALHRTYMTLNELKAALKSKHQTRTIKMQDDGFKLVRS
jgi:hypothetical protein